MRPPRFRGPLPALLVILLAALAFAAPAAAHPGGTPGAPGIGDKLYATLGNGGYDVLHYDLDLRYATSAPAQPVEGTVTIVARATQSLSRFDLDFAGDAVGDVTVNGRSAQWSRDGDELVITPRSTLRRGRLFVVQVRHFVATPTLPDPTDLLSVAFFTTPDGSATAGQPDSAHVFLPSNDHPRDKASFSFRIDVPEGTTAVANGVFTGKRTHAGRTTWSYLQRQPMATELIQLAVGNYDLTVRGRHADVFVRDVTAPSLTAELVPKLAVELEQIDWMEQKVGDYPFDTYGSFVVNTALGFALETQTLSLYDVPWFHNFGEGTWNPTMLHELSHMWFGDSVAPYEWSDVWLNEGHATWYQWLWGSEKGFLGEDTGTGTNDLTEVMRLVYGIEDFLRAAGGPPGQPLSGAATDVFDINRYWGGALTLFALREEIGTAAFERLERAWVRKYRNGVASTRDFIALASRIAGRDLGPFLNAWLYDAHTPPMPNHPDWTVQAADAPAARATARSINLPPDVRRR
jgi:aminopeptidase N